MDILDRFSELKNQRRTGKGSANANKKLVRYARALVTIGHERVYFPEFKTLPNLLEITRDLKFKLFGKDTVLSQIIKLVKEAQGSKPPVQRIADKAVVYFIPVVLLIAISSTCLNS